MIKELSEKDFQKTFGQPMKNVTNSAKPVVNIWPYVEVLVKNNIVDQYVFDKNLVEIVYRNGFSTFDHILLPTSTQNVFITIVVDLIDAVIYGYKKLDLRELYGAL